MLLFFPLPLNVSSLLPSPSLHTLSASPYWSGSAFIGGTYVATTEALNWTDTQLVDTGIVPYARGESILFDTSTSEGPNNGAYDLSVDNNVVGSMPRAWAPLVMGGSDEGRVLVLYQDSRGMIWMEDVVGGNNKTYQVIQFN
ncbi:hypothetical protein F5884DRAFT_769902, partial [Xylogone sp. PMI_703]